MARSNSTKKVAKLAKNRGRSVRQPRRLGFPALVVGILVVGSLLVGLARSSRGNDVELAPTIGDDWFAAYGFNVCGEWIDNLAGVDGGDAGVSTSSDGFIRLPSSVEEAAGNRADVGAWADEIGIEINSDGFVLPGEEEPLVNGDECEEGAGESIWRVARWASVDDPEPDIFQGGFSRIRFQQDAEVYTFFFGPDDADIPQPPSAGQVPADQDAPPASGDDTSTTVVDEGADDEPADEDPADDEGADDDPADEDTSTTVADEDG